MSLLKLDITVTAQLKQWFATASLRFLTAGLLTSLMYLPPASVYAAPFTPASDDEVLISLPKTASIDVASRSLASATLSDAERISRAQKLLAIAYDSANEDAFGQAEALLSPWVNEEKATQIPIDVYVMLAVIRQHNHEFSKALELLNFVLTAEPANYAALMQRVQINLVLGDYAAVRLDCQSLIPIVSSAIAANCVAQVASVTGQARPVYIQLKNLGSYQAYFSPAEYLELMLTLATVTHRLGLIDETESYYELVLAQDEDNMYAVLQYTDFLLEQRRFGEVLTLLEQLPAQVMTLELQVKHLEALGESGQPAAYAAQHRELEDVFAVAKTRAENFPNKEYARFLLQTPQHASEAVKAALANWQYQKEPGDLLLLVRAAVAADSVSEITLAKDWIATTGLEDQRISALLEARDVGTSNIAEGEN
ncbi:MAG: hypothetical protein V4628_04005 [Pseudomonadota bacterium]